jgi:hypothetical protein
MAAPESARSAWRSRGKTAFRIEESCLTRDPDQSSSGVEDRHQQQREHDDRETELEGAGKIHLEEGRRERGRPRGKAVPGLKTESDRDQRYAEHADDDAAWNFPRGETGDDKEARSSEKGLRLPQIAERDQRHGMSATMPAFCNPIRARKSPMPAAMPSFKFMGRASISQARKGESDSAKKSTPETKTRASASCQLP